MNLNKITRLFLSYLGLSVFAFSSLKTMAQSTPTFFSKGSYVIDMGVTPQTVNNALKPYGLIYAITKNTRVPVSWIIKNGKSSLTEVDFSHNGKDYRGGPFVIPKEYRSTTVDSIVNSWKSLYSGLTVDTLMSRVQLPQYRTLSYVPVWTLDAQNGAIAQTYLNNAGIPTSAYNWVTPAQLSCCNDLFVMPHADPTWATHSNLLNWNSDTANGGCGGWIWAACHAASALENMFNTSNPSQQTNFLTEKTGTATGSGPYAVSNSLILWGSHGGGTVPYTYNSVYSRPEMQIMNDLTPATENGSEQIYIAKTKWRSSTILDIIDPDQPDIPFGTQSKAVKLAVGRAFGDPDNGMVMYEAGHSHAKASLESNFAAQRAFFNFSIEAPEAKFPTITTSVPASMTGGVTYQLSSTATGKTGPFQYRWSAACAGSFNNPYIPNPTFTPTLPGSNINCAVSLTVTDACGRIAYEATAVVVTPSPQPPVAVKDSVFCNPWSTVTSSAASNDSDPEGSPLSFTHLSSLTTSKGVFTLNSAGTFSYDPSPSFTNGHDTLTYQVCDTTGLCDTAIIVVRVSYPDSDGDGKTDETDIDDDNDGITDVTEGGGVNDPSGDADADGLPNYVDSSPGGGIVWADVNSDGINDNFDKDKDGIANHLDLDSDNDGISDAIEANGGTAPTNYSASGATAGTITGSVGTNGMPNAAETVADNGTSVYANPDTDGDGIKDYLDIDADGDGITDAIEANAGVTPTNYSSTTGTITSTVGSNGWPNTVDPSAGGTALAITNTDGAALADYRDIDSDNDGIVDNIEAQSTAGYVAKTGLDTDGDGWDNAYDATNGGTAFSVYNFDGTDNPDYRDTDTDNDGILDIREGHDNNKNGNADWDLTDASLTGNDVVDAGENNGSATTDTDADGLLRLWDPSASELNACSYSSILGQGTGSTGNGGCAALQNTDGSGDRDWRDTDDDNDGILTTNEKTDLIGISGSTSPNLIRDYLEAPCGSSLFPYTVRDTIYASSVIIMRANGSVVTDPSAVLDAPDEVGVANFGASNQVNVDTLIVDFGEISQTSTIRFFAEAWAGAADLELSRSTNGTTWTSFDSITTAPTSGAMTWDGVSIASTLSFTSNSEGSFRYLKFREYNTSTNAITVDAIAVLRNYVECRSPILADNDTAYTYQNTSKIISIQDNDTNYTGLTPIVTIYDAPNRGTVVVNVDGTVTYTPNANVTTNDTFFYSLCTDAGYCDSARVIVRIPTSICGNGKSTAASSSIGRAYTLIKAVSIGAGGDNAALGAPDGVYSRLNSATDSLILDLGSTAYQNTAILIRCRNSKTAGTMGVRTSAGSAGPWSDLQTFTFAVANTVYDKSYTVNTTGGVRYISFTRGGGTGNLEIDALEYDSLGYVCTNAKPEAVNDTLTTPYNTVLNYNIRNNDYDPYGDTVTVRTTVLTSPINGTITYLTSAGQLRYTPTSGFTGTDSFRYRISDTLQPGSTGSGGGVKYDTAWVYITITHNPPVAINDYDTVEQGSELALNLFTNDSEPESRPLTLTIADSTVNGGAIVVGLNGAIYYTPQITQSGADSVRYIICDDQNPSKCDTAWAVFWVTEIPPASATPPVANRDSAVTEINEFVVITVLTNDTDPDNEPLSVTNVGTSGSGVTNGLSAAGGTIVINYDYTVIYTPPTNYTGTDSFMYIITDGQGNYDTTTVRVTVSGALNDPPVANNDNLIAYWDNVGGVGVTTTVKPFTNDYDVDGTLDSSLYSNPSNLVGVQVVTNPTKGNASWNPATGQFSYTPTSSQPDGTLDSFRYKVCDTGTPLPALCDTAWVYIIIYNGNDAPIALRDNEIGYVNQDLYVVVADNDSDPEGSTNMTKTITDQANNGTASFTAFGLLKYVPNPGFVGNDTMIYQLCDGAGTVQACDTALVVVTILNNPPIATPDLDTTIYNTPTSVYIRPNDAEPDGHIFIITDLAPTSGFTTGDTTSGASTSRGGTVTKNNNGTPTNPTDDYINYTPPTNYSGLDTFWYQICDNVSAPNTGCATTYVIILVQDNTNPIALNDFDTTSPGIAVLVDVMFNDYDETGSLVPSTVAVANGNTFDNGSYSINGTTGKVTYTPNYNFIGNDTMAYRVCDNAVPAKCDTALAIVTVNEGNNVFAVNDINSTLIYTPVTGDVLTNDVDPQSDVINFGGFENPSSPGTFVSSGNITLTGVNSAGTPVSNAGSLSINPNGTYTFTPNGSFTGYAEATYAICDDGSPVACDTALLRITVLPLGTTVNQVFANDDYIISFRNTVTANVLSNDDDPQGDSYTVSTLKKDTNGDGIPDAYASLGSGTTVAGIDINNVPVANAGTLTLNANGSYTFVPNSAFAGQVTAFYTMCDNNVSPVCDSAYLIIDVTPGNGASNDPPFAGDDFASTVTNTATTGDWASNDSEANGDSIRVNGTAALKLTALGAGTNLDTLTTLEGGTVIIKNNGTYTYTPPTNYIGPDQVEYTICDVTIVTPQPLCHTATIYLLVAAENRTLAVDDDNNTFAGIAVNGNVKTNDYDPEQHTQTFGSFLNQSTLAGITSGATLTGISDLNTPVGNAGTLTFTGNGSYVFTPANGFIGTVSVPYRICDNGIPSACDTAYLNIHVDSLPNILDPNDNNLIANNDDAVSFGETITLNALSNDADPEADSFYAVSFKYDSNSDGIPDANGTIGAGAIQVSGISQNGLAVANAGTFTMNGTGTYTFDPAANFVGTVTLSYAIRDSVSSPNTATDTALIQITVYGDNGPLNDPPFAGDDYATGSQVDSIVGSWALNDSESNLDSISMNGSTTHVKLSGLNTGNNTVIYSTSTLRGGTIEFFANGTYGYEPPTDYYGPDRVTYRICDVTTVNPQPLCDSATVYLTVLPVVRDYGDLPDGYGDAWNTYMDRNFDGRPDGDNAIWLGALVSKERRTKKSQNAGLDNNDDGLLIPNDLDTNGNATTFRVIVNGNTSGDTVHFKLWFDWDQNGTLEDVYYGYGVTGSPDTVDVAVFAPLDDDGAFFSRLRVATDSVTLDSTGTWVNGETEDNIGNMNPVPVTLLHFTAREHKGNGLLEWATATEIDNDYFEVQKSVNGVTWNTIGFVDGHGTSYEVNHYSFTDRRLEAGPNYYRLKQIDFNKRFEYSPVRVIVVGNDGQSRLNVYPNPTSELINVRLNLPTTIGATQIEVLDITGRVVKHLEYTEQNGQSLHSVILVNDLNEGIYFVRVTSGIFESTQRIQIAR